MAEKKLYAGSMGPYLYDDTDNVDDDDGDFSGVKMHGSVSDGGHYAAFLTLTDLTATRLVSSDANKKLVSTDLAAWVTGTVNQITVTDDGDGTITLSTPQDIDTDADVEFDSAILDDLTASRLVASDGSKKLVSSDATNWVAGTANEITVVDDADGSVTIEGAGDDTDFTVVTAIQDNAGTIEYKTRALTLNGGIITTVGAESGWTSI